MKGGGLRETIVEKSLAVGRKKFVEWTKAVPGRKARVKNLVNKKKIGQLRDYPVPNMANFGIKNDGIEGENSYFFNDSSYASR